MKKNNIMTNEQEKVLLEAIYKRYGKPNKIYKEKETLYDGWNSGGTQRGRAFIYNFTPCPEGGPDKTKIDSYFFKLRGSIVRVYMENCNLDPDLVVNI
jgi:hypothetical protein